LFGHSQFDVTSIEVERGDTFLLYTDGLTESRNPSNLEYGEERLIALVSGKRALPPHDLLSACLTDLAGFRSSAPMVDDLTIMALNRK
jgi:sigma-B regulation protein RsbU (phosphoserine phosphatase)